MTKKTSRFRSKFALDLQLNQHRCLANILRPPVYFSGHDLDIQYRRNLSASRPKQIISIPPFYCPIWVSILHLELPQRHQSSLYSSHQQVSLCSLAPVAKLLHRPGQVAVPVRSEVVMLPRATHPEHQLELRPVHEQSLLLWRILSRCLCLAQHQ